MAVVILMAIFDYYASALSSKIADSCMKMHSDSPQSAGMPKDLQILSQSREMAAGEEFADSVLFCSFADAAFASDVDSDMSPWHLVSAECGVSAGGVDVASTAAEVAAFEFVAVTAIRL